MNQQRDSTADSDRGDTGPGRNEYDDGSRSYAAYAPNSVERDRGEILAREQEAYGGIKVGSAFFGWLTATGVAVLLTAMVVAAGTAVGVSTGADPETAVAGAANDPGTVGLIGGIILLVILFVAYFCGGYVAGRMSRFNGLQQGLAVWLWAAVIALGVAGVAAVAGSRFDVLSDLNSFPRIPVDGGALTNGGIIALVVVAIASLAGALLGGVAGMRFHRKVDRVGLGR
ncbi:hypothetical protein V6K52_00865 [Knoellia sp. S7-12]|uniref:hypothetical protein n=1 Tax=Knoellia sp. S7-12 TaxID=3126698 RepID=UPI0033661534